MGQVTLDLKEYELLNDKLNLYKKTINKQNNKIDE